MSKQLERSQTEIPLGVKETLLKDRISKEYPALYMDRFLLVDATQTRLVIDDISYRTETPIQDDIETLALSCQGWMEVYDAKKLTLGLAERIQGLFRVLNTRRTLVIFPGEGAQVVKDLLPEDSTEGVTTVDVGTERVVSKTGAVEGVELTGKTQVREAIGDVNPEAVVVLDDAIVTSATLTAVRNAFPVRKAAWYAGSLMTLSPLQRKLGISVSGVEGYTGIITPIVYQGTNGIPAVNSLSTLVGDSQKSQIVRSAYMDKYVEDQESFLATVEQLKRVL